MPLLSWIASNLLLAFLLALMAWFIQRARLHSIARILWILVLIKLLTPPLVIVPLNESPGNSACLNDTCSCGPHLHTILSRTLVWVLLPTWIVGATVTGWIAWCRWIRFRRLTAHAVSAPPEWQSEAARLSAELSLRYPPEILAVPGRLPPLVVPGRYRPQMLLPASLMEQLNEVQRTVLILHELTHIKRGDHLVRILELVVRIVYWWLPVVSAISRQLRTCEETCCDASVVDRQPQARRDYARLLLDVLDFVAPAPQAIEHGTAMNSAHDLERRLRTILDTGTRIPPRRWLVGSIAAVMACGIVPCELHYDWLGVFVPATSRVEPESSPDPIVSPNDDWVVDINKNLCCPH